MNKFLLSAMVVFPIFFLAHCTPIDTDNSTPATVLACTDTTFPLANIGITAPAGQNGYPAGMTKISASSSVCIDKYEAFLVEVTGSGDKPWSPYKNPGATAVKAISAPGAVPQGYISQTQAAAACANAGKRLCTDTEWLLACKGSGGNKYPYGNTFVAGNCNTTRATHPAVEYFGTSAAWIYNSNNLNNPCLDQLTNSLAKTGAYSNCVTANGLFDMSGNLHEWTADPTGTFRGGYYVDAVLNGDGCNYATTAHDVSYSDFGTGFRCCAD